MTINHVKKIKMKARKKTITLINNVNGNDKKKYSKMMTTVRMIMILSLVII